MQDNKEAHKELYEYLLHCDHELDDYNFNKRDNELYEEWEVCHDNYTYTQYLNNEVIDPNSLKRIKKSTLRENKFIFYKKNKVLEFFKPIYISKLKDLDISKIDQLFDWSKSRVYVHHLLFWSLIFDPDIIEISQDLKQNLISSMTDEDRDKYQEWQKLIKQKRKKRPKEFTGNLWLFLEMLEVQEIFVEAAQVIKNMLEDASYTYNDYKAWYKNLNYIENRLWHILASSMLMPERFKQLRTRCNYFDLDGRVTKLLSDSKRKLEISMNQGALYYMEDTIEKIFQIYKHSNYQEKDFLEFLWKSNYHSKNCFDHILQSAKKTTLGKVLDIVDRKYKDLCSLSMNIDQLINAADKDFLEKKERIFSYYYAIKNNNAEYDTSVVEQIVDKLLIDIEKLTVSHKEFIPDKYMNYICFSYEQSYKEIAGILYELIDIREKLAPSVLRELPYNIDGQELDFFHDEFDFQKPRLGLMPFAAAKQQSQIVRELTTAKSSVESEEIIQKHLLKTWSNAITLSPNAYLRWLAYEKPTHYHYFHQYILKSKQSCLQKVENRMMTFLCSGKYTYEQYQDWIEHLECLEAFCYQDLKRKIDEKSYLERLPRHLSCSSSIDQQITNLKDNLGALPNIEAEDLSEKLSFSLKEKFTKGMLNSSFKHIEKQENSILTCVQEIIVNYKTMQDLIYFEPVVFVNLANTQHDWNSMMSMIKDEKLEIVDIDNLIFAYEGYKIFLFINNQSSWTSIDRYSKVSLSNVLELASLLAYKKQVYESIFDEERLYNEYKNQLNSSANNYLHWLSGLSEKEIACLKNFKERYKKEIKAIIREYMVDALHKQYFSYRDYLDWRESLNDVEFACYEEFKDSLNEEYHLQELKKKHIVDAAEVCETLTKREYGSQEYYQKHFSIENIRLFNTSYENYCHKYYEIEPTESTWASQHLIRNLEQSIENFERLKDYCYFDHSYSIRFPNIGLIDDIAKAFALLTVKKNLKLVDRHILEFKYKKQSFFFDWSARGDIAWCPVDVDEHRAMLKKISADKHRDYLAKQVNLVAGEIKLDDAHEADWQKRQRQIIISDEEKRKKNQAAMYNYMILRYDLAKQINLLPAIESFIKSCESQADDPNILNKIRSWEKSLSFVESQIYYQLQQQPAIEGSLFDKTTKRWQEFDANSASDSQSIIEDIYNKLCLVLDCNISNSPSALNKEEFNENLWSKNYNIIPLQVIKYKDLADKLDAKIMQWNQQGELELVNILFDYMLEDDNLDIQESDRSDFIKGSFGSYMPKVLELYHDYLDLKKIPCEKFYSLRTDKWLTILKKVLINYLDPSKNIDKEELLRTIDFLSGFHYLGDDLSQSARKNYSGEFFIVNNELMLFKLFLDHDIQDLLQIRNKSWKLIEKLPSSLLEEVRSLSKAEFDDFYKTVHHNDKYDIADYLPKEISSIKRFLNFRKVYMTFRQLIVKAEHNKMLRKLDQYTANYEYKPIQGGYCDIESLYRVFNYDKDFKQKTLELELNIVNQIRAKYNFGEISKAEYELIDHFVHDLCFNKSIKDSFETYSHSARYKNELLEHCLDCVEYILGDQDDEALPEHLSRLVQIVVNEYYKY